MQHADTFGQLLRDTYAQRDTKDISSFSGGLLYAIERDDDYLSLTSSFIYFLTPDKFPPNEKRLLDMAQGRTVELACGAGRMSAYLQEKGMEVIATDVSDGALEICQDRGLNVQPVDFTDPASLIELKEEVEEIDTLLIFGNSLPVIGTQEKLTQFLNTAWEITSDSGRVMGDFNSPVPVRDQLHLDYHQRNRNRGNPIGLIKIRIRYLNMVSDWFDFWLPTVEEFRAAVAETKWKLELIEEPGYYFILSKT